MIRTRRPLLPAAVGTVAYTVDRHMVDEQKAKNLDAS
jgi:hypothetical protein